MLNLETKSIVANNRVTIETTPTSSVLDVSQELIKHSLVERFAARGAEGLTTGNAELLIDIAILGIRKEVSGLTRTWNCESVYPIRMYHATVILGPLCTIGHSPCPLCLERRWLAIRPREEQEALDTLQQALVLGTNPRLIPATLELIWTVLEGTLYENVLPKPAVDKNWLYALHLDSLRLTRHELIADSSCPACAHPKPDTKEAAVLSLSSHVKRDASESRLIKPLEYDLPEDGYVNPACGMLGSISTVDRLHTVTAPVTGKFLLRNKYELYDVWWGGHSTNFNMSRRIGILEGLERYSGHWSRAKKVSVIDSYQNLASDALDPRTCGLYHPDFYEAAYPYTMPFNVERKSSWVWGYSFQQARPLLVPEQLAYYAGPTDNSPPYVHDCSNGCAIGSCIEEAILFGLLELIERDNFLLCWYAKLSPPSIDPWSSRSLNTLRLLDRIDLMGYDMHFLDTRLDMQIPTITAVAVKREDSYGKLVLAAGVGLDPEDAIRGALCEVAAYVATIGDRVKKNLAQVRTLASDFSKVNSLDQHPLIYGLPEMAKHAEFLLQNPRMISVEEAYKTQMAEHPLNRDLLDDLQSCIDIILKLGMDVIVVDQTCPELEGTGLKVASVIVPGLMPIDFGWGRQRVFTLPRLRTVPRTAGFLTRDFDPALLNLTPHPFP